MRTSHCRLAAWVLSVSSLALLFTGSAVQGQSAAPGAKSIKTNRIEFKVDVLAGDPFSPLNQVGVTKREFRRGETIQVVITGIPAPGFHTYPMKQNDNPKARPFVSRLGYKNSAPGLEPLAPVIESPPMLATQETVGPILEYEAPFTWMQEVLVLPEAAPGTSNLRVQINATVCDVRGCQPMTITFDLPIEVSPSPPAELTADLKQRLAAALAAKAPKGGDTSSPAAGTAKALPISDDEEQYKASMDKLADELQTTSSAQNNATGLLAFILAGVFWGGVSLITPCVFPMIPITVSFFLKQSEKQHYRPVTMALVYCGTIIVVLTIAAVALLSFFRWLSVNPIMNFALGGLFIFFALSLFGMYEIELPSGLARFTSSREGKGGLLGTMFMALTFTIVSFACVAPFLGGFGGTAGGGDLNLSHRILGGLAFAVTFASPFFVLALFPNLLKKMPKSGSWLNSVKVVMGFLELAAALKFFRAGELVLLASPTLFTYDLVLGTWIAICLLCGLYLLGFYRLPHDTPLDHLGVPRMLFGLAFLSLGFYLLPAQFKVNAEGEAQRPNGTIYAWIDSFLLPEPGKSELPWSGNLKGVLDEARAEQAQTGKPQLVFVDFTGETCTNCKINEKTVFSKPDIRPVFQKYHLVQLYTDKVPNKFYSGALRSRFGSDVSRQHDDARANLLFQKKAFGTEQLPLYVILEPRPDGKVEVVAKYEEGKINDEAAFAQFLKGPLENTERVAQASGK
jgi:thiol:disulfide interchange protein